jgi:hypothetical protein
VVSEVYKLCTTALRCRVSRRRIWGRLNRPRPRVLLQETPACTCFHRFQKSLETMCTTEKNVLFFIQKNRRDYVKKNYAQYSYLYVYIYVPILTTFLFLYVLYTIGTSKLDCCVTTYMNATFGKAPEMNVLIWCFCIILYFILLYYIAYIENNNAYVLLLMKNRSIGCVRLG